MDSLLRKYTLTKKPPFVRKRKDRLYCLNPAEGE
jgi:hypothetical protein